MRPNFFDISMCVASFNAHETIGNALESACTQNWPKDRFEVIVVDDASTDETPSVLKELQETLSFRLIVNEENRGVGTVRNQLIKQAKGEFIAFFDDDDVSDPDRIQKQYERICIYEEKFAQGMPVICHTARMQIFSDGRQRIEPTVGVNPGIVAPNGEEMLRRLLVGEKTEQTKGSVATCAQMARRSVYENIGGFDEKARRSEDTEFCIRAAREGAHFVGISEPLVTQYITSGTDKSPDAEVENMIYVLAKHKDLVNSYGSYEFEKSWVELKYDLKMRRFLPVLVNFGRIVLKYPEYLYRKAIS